MLKNDVIELMTSVQGPPKCELQSHVLGILSVYVMTSAASTTQHRSSYKVLGTVVCEAVFMGAYAVSNFVMKKLQALAESNCSACIRGCAEGVDFCPSRLAYREKEIEQYINLGPGQNCTWVYEADQSLCQNYTT